MEIKNISFLQVHDLEPDKIESSRRALGTLVVHEDTSVLTVAQAADALGEQARIVVLVNTDDAITGLFCPEEFRTRFGKQDENSLTDVVTRLTQAPNALSALLGSFNFERPDMVWCSKGGHYTTPPRCAVHR